MADIALLCLQLLLDLSGIKQGLLKLPQALSASNATYTRFVNKGVGRIETLLKVVMASEHVSRAAFPSSQASFVTERNASTSPPKNSWRIIWS